MFKKLLLFFVLRFDNACQKYEFNYSNVEKNLLFEVLFLTSQCFTQFKGCTFSSFLRPCVFIRYQIKIFEVKIFLALIIFYKMNTDNDALLKF